MSKVVEVSGELLDEISDIYNKAAEIIEEAVLKVDYSKTEMQTSYRGLGEDLVVNSIVKLKEHLELLEEFLIQTKEYVQYTKETIQTTDEALANEIGG